MSNSEIQQALRAELASWDVSVFESFASRYNAQLESIVAEIANAHTIWKEFDSTINGSQDRAYISALIFAAASLLMTSTKQLVWGLLAPSGNSMRQVLETICLALLCSKPALGFLPRYADGSYRSHNAVRDVMANLEALNLNEDGMKVLRRSKDFYNAFSHPSLMTLGTFIALGSGGTLFGAAFDEGKSFGYDKEINIRLQEARLLPNFIAGVRHNLGDQ